VVDLRQSLSTLRETAAALPTLLASDAAAVLALTADRISRLEAQKLVRIFPRQTNTISISLSLKLRGPYGAYAVGRAGVTTRREATEFHLNQELEYNQSFHPVVTRKASHRR
jgi:hypothetical protein